MLRFFVGLLLGIILTAQASPRTQGMDPELTRLIKTFSEDVGENGQAAWQKLQSYPRKDLIDSLLGMRENLPKDSPMQLSVAFVLCNLNYEYQTNVQSIVSALTNVSAQPELLCRYRRGDAWSVDTSRRQSLLRVLFGAVPWSDAALSE